MGDLIKLYMVAMGIAIIGVVVGLWLSERRSEPNTDIASLQGSTSLEVELSDEDQMMLDRLFEDLENEWRDRQEGQLL